MRILRVVIKANTQRTFMPILLPIEVVGCCSNALIIFLAYQRTRDSWTAKSKESDRDSIPDFPWDHTVLTCFLLKFWISTFHGFAFNSSLTWVKVLMLLFPLPATVFTTPLLSPSLFYLWFLRILRVIKVSSKSFEFIADSISQSINFNNFNS